MCVRHLHIYLMRERRREGDGTVSFNILSAQLPTLTRSNNNKMRNKTKEKKPTKYCHSAHCRWQKPITTATAVWLGSLYRIKYIDGDDTTKTFHVNHGLELLDFYIYIYFLSLCAIISLFVRVRIIFALNKLCIRRGRGYLDLSHLFRSFSPRQNSLLPSLRVIFPLGNRLFFFSIGDFCLVSLSPCIRSSLFGFHPCAFYYLSCNLPSISHIRRSYGDFVIRWLPSLVSFLFYRWLDISASALPFSRLLRLRRRRRRRSAIGDCCCW